MATGLLQGDAGFLAGDRSTYSGLDCYETNGDYTCVAGSWLDLSLGRAQGGLYSDVKAAIRQIFENNEDCANLFGGADEANRTLDEMYLIDVPNTPWAWTSEANGRAWNLLMQSNAGNNNIAARTVWRIPAGQTVGWNGGSYNTYVGTVFANQQTATLMHENARNGPSEDGIPE